MIERRFRCENAFFVCVNGEAWGGMQRVALMRYRYVDDIQCYALMRCICRANDDITPFGGWWNRFG